MPKPEVPCAVIIAGDIRVTFEETFADAENIKAAEENDDEEEAEDDSQRRHGITVAVNDGQ